MARSNVDVGEFSVVRAIPDDAVFISDSHDVREIREGNLPAGSEEYDSFFLVLDASGADYAAIYGMEGIVPYLDREVVRVL